jgi:hypothetical protein
MISWLNKQLNEKPGIGGIGFPPTSTYKAPTVTSIGSSLTGLTKPPVASTTNSFKPTFASVE